MTTEDVHQIFEKYDKNKSKAIEVEELRNMLSDLGLLTNKTLAEVDSFVIQQFVSADSDKDSKLDYDEFAAYYSKVTAPKLSETLAQELPEKVDQLKQVFLAFANFGSRQTVEDMDGAKFSKLCKDVKLVGKSLSSTDVDLIFVKVKARSERRITFDQFIQALSMCGEKKGMELPAIVDHILESDGPITHATKAEFVKFHDDKSTYTGVHAHGGPLTVEVPDDLASLVRRESGRRSSLPSPGGSTGSRTPGMLTPSSSFVGSARRARPSTEGGEFSTDELRMVFKTFATFGQVRASLSPAAHLASPSTKLEMDSARFAKLCRDSGLLGGKLNSTAVDLCFTKVKPKGVRKINYKQFLEAIELLAQEKGVPVEEVKGALAACEGPMLNSVTKTDYVKFHDDKSTYTGVHANGGPTTTNGVLTAN